MNHAGRLVPIVAAILSSLAFCQQNGATPPSSSMTYVNSVEGLQQQLKDTIAAIESGNQTAESALFQTLIMPVDSTWFKDEYGPAFGPRLSAAYQRLVPDVQEEIPSVFRGNTHRGWSSPKIFKYDDPAIANSPTDDYLNCMDNIVALYETAFNGQRTAVQAAFARPNDPPTKSHILAGDIPGYYVYYAGAFRFIPHNVFALLPKERPVRIQLDMSVMRSKLIGGMPTISREMSEQIMQQRIHGKVVIRFVVDVTGKIKDINVVEGPPNLSDLFLQSVKQWSFGTTTLDGDPVEVEVNYETGVKINGQY